MQAGSIDLLQPRVLRPNWRLRTETRSRYDHLVANGVVDRHEWAQVVLELIDAEGKDRAHGARTRFAEKVGVNVRTIGVWLAKGVDVKETNVRAAAKAYGLGEMELLIRVGFYSLDQLPERPTTSPLDEERRRVLESDLSTDMKARILKELDRMEAEDEAAIEQLREKDRRRRAERVTALLEQRRTA